MAFSKEDLAQIISGKARELCTPEASQQRSVHNMSGGNRLNEDYNRGYEDENFRDPFVNDSSYESYETTPLVNNGKDIQISAKRVAESNLPDAIKKMMIENPIDVTPMNPHKSVLSGLNIQSPKRQENIKETYQPQINNNGGIDYSLIKLIIEECVDRKMKEYMGKQSLNENTLKTIGLSEGKIKLVDNKGNVFMSKLEYQGNINDKKK